MIPVLWPPDSRRRLAPAPRRAVRAAAGSARPGFTAQPAPGFAAEAGQCRGRQGRRKPRSVPAVRPVPARRPKARTSPDRRRTATSARAAGPEVRRRSPLRAATAGRRVLRPPSNRSRGTAHRPGWPGDRRHHQAGPVVRFGGAARQISTSGVRLATGDRRSRPAPRARRRATSAVPSWPGRRLVGIDW